MTSDHPSCGEPAGHFEISVAEGKRYDPPLLALAFCGLPAGHDGDFHQPAAAPARIDDEGF